MDNSLFLLIVGINHKTAPVEVRERLAWSMGQLPTALRLLKRGVNETIILSTCNRTEVYAVVDLLEAGDQGIKQFLCDSRHVSIEEVSPYLYSYYQQEAVRHLFRVASGLDSMVVGEAQILGQVRAAFESAQDASSVGPLLTNLFREALRVSKFVRNQTVIGQNGASISQACVEMAQRVIGELSSRKVLVIGAGKIGKLTARTFVDYGVADLLVTSRTPERAQELAVRLGGKPIGFERLGEAMTALDLVVSSTNSPHFVLKANTVEQAMQRRRDRHLYLIDLAVPRDIEPEVRHIAGVFLYDIDDLKSIYGPALREQELEINKAEDIIASEATRFMAWWHSLEVVPTVVALRRQAEAIRQREVTKFLRKFPGLSEGDRQRIEALTTAIMNKLIHRPLVKLRDEDGGQRYVRAVHNLFALDKV